MKNLYGISKSGEPIRKNDENMKNNRNIWRFVKVGDLWIPKVILGDVRKVVKYLPNNFIDCVITSPPYWMQRDYKHPDQIGREKTPEEYVETIVRVFSALRPKLKRSATVFLNVGYKYLQDRLLLIPEMIALKMERAGFILKNKIIWWKPNAMPTPARDRLNNVYEPVLFFIRDDGKEVHYFNLEELSQKPKTLENYIKLLSILPEVLLGVKVVDSLSERNVKEGKVIGVRFTSKPIEILVKWKNGTEEWIPFGDPLKNYPEKVSFTCPICGASLSEWDIKLSFANYKQMICPECGSLLCRSPDTFPIPQLRKAEEVEEKNVREIINPDVQMKKYVTKAPKSSKFLKAGEEVFAASPAGRLAVQGEYITVKRRWDPPQPLIAEYLRYWRTRRGISIEKIDKKLGYSYTAGHWFRLDFGWWGRGGSIPRPSDWYSLKEILGFNNVYEELVCDKIAVLQTVKPHEKGRNPGDIWKIKLEQYPEAHFSVFPRKLVEMAIRLGCPPRGVVLDPFAGSGTVGEVTMKLGRKAILIELVPQYLKLIKKRCNGLVDVILGKDLWKN